MAQLVICNANKKNIKLNLTNKDEKGWYPLLTATKYNNIEMVKLIINYANENNIILNINDKNEEGWYPLLYAAHNNNIEMTYLIIDYANITGIKLDINDLPLQSATSNENCEMVKLIKNYTIQNNIKMKKSFSSDSNTDSTLCNSNYFESDVYYDSDESNSFFNDICSEFSDIITLESDIDEEEEKP